MEGVSKRDFAQRFGVEADSIYGENIRFLVEKGLLEEKGDCLRLTKRGIDVSNYVFVELLNIAE